MSDEDKPLSKQLCDCDWYLCLDCYPPCESCEDFGCEECYSGD